VGWEVVVSTVTSPPCRLGTVGWGVAPPLIPQGPSTACITVVSHIFAERTTISKLEPSRSPANSHSCLNRAEFTSSQRNRQHTLRVRSYTTMDPALLGVPALTPCLGISWPTSSGLYLHDRGCT